MKYIRLTMIALITVIAVPFSLHAQELVQDKQEIVRAQVVHIDSEKDETIPGTDTQQTIQELQVKILEGASVGKTISLRNDFTKLDTGETFYVIHITPWDGKNDTYTVSEPYRLPQLGVLLIIFLVVVIIFGGKQGIRGIASLCGSLVLILFVLMPGISHGYSPVWLSIGIASLIIVIGSYVTHGFNRTTSAAVVGMIATIVFIGILTHFMLGYTRLTGYGNEESVYLDLNSHGTLDMMGILLGGILIGLLGVMYDAAIGQAIAVEELHHIAPHVNRKTIYTRSLRIGREHIGALVNTLAIAYVGTALPLLLLFYTSSNASAGVTINREIFSTEIVRSLIGSIGLVLAVPITTFISVFMIVKKNAPNAGSTSEIQHEQTLIEHTKHHHS